MSPSSGNPDSFDIRLLNDKRRHGRNRKVKMCQYHKKGVGSLIVTEQSRRATNLKVGRKTRRQVRLKDKQKKETMKFLSRNVLSPLIQP